jgi:hypothetical protein
MVMFVSSYVYGYVFLMEQYLVFLAPHAVSVGAVIHVHAAVLYSAMGIGCPVPWPCLGVSDWLPGSMGTLGI